jgi:hypothetical protein
MDSEIINKLCIVQQELSIARKTITELTTERNKYRSQALMRANKIEELQNELQKIYSPKGN